MTKQKMSPFRKLLAAISTNEEYEKAADRVAEFTGGTAKVWGPDALLIEDAGPGLHMHWQHSGEVLEVWIGSAHPSQLVKWMEARLHSATQDENTRDMDMEKIANDRESFAEFLAAVMATHTIRAKNEGFKVLIAGRGDVVKATEILLSARARKGLQAYFSESAPPPPEPELQPQESVQPAPPRPPDSTPPGEEPEDEDDLGDDEEEEQGTPSGNKTPLAPNSDGGGTSHGPPDTDVEEADDEEEPVEDLDEDEPEEESEPEEPESEGEEDPEPAEEEPAEDLDEDEEEDPGEAEPAEEESAEPAEDEEETDSEEGPGEDDFHDGPVEVILDEDDEPGGSDGLDDDEEEEDPEEEEEPAEEEDTDTEAATDAGGKQVHVHIHSSARRTAAPTFMWNNGVMEQGFKTWHCSWMGEIVGMVVECGPEGKPFVAMALSACTKGEMMAELGEFKTLKDAQEAAEMCPECGDSPCEALSEPTDEVQARVKRTAAPVFKWVPEDVGNGHTYWSGVWMGAEVAIVSDDAAGDKPFCASALEACGPGENMVDVGYFRTLKEAQNAARTCPGCGDIPCEALAEPTEEVQARARRTAAPTIRWQKKRSIVSDILYIGYWMGMPVATVDGDKSKEGEHPIYSAKSICYCDPSFTVNENHDFRDCGDFKTLEKAQEAARACQLCGDTPCEALSEPTEEVVRANTVRAAVAQRLATSGTIHWMHHPRGIPEYVGKWMNIEVASVTREVDEFDGGPDTFSAYALCNCGDYAGDGNDEYLMVDTYDDPKEAKENAEICPQCGDNPCSGFSEPTEEVEAKVKRTAAPIFTWRDIDDEMSSGKWMGKHEVAQITMERKKWEPGHYAKCDNNNEHGMYREVPGRFKDKEEAKTEAETCPICGDTPCSGWSEPTEEVPRKARVVQASGRSLDDLDEKSWDEFCALYDQASYPEADDPKLIRWLRNKLGCSADDAADFIGEHTLELEG